MFRPIFLTLLALGLLLPAAQAKVAVQNSQFGFSFELPLGFREVPKSAGTPEDIVATYTHPPLPRQPPITVVVTRLHGTLENPPAPVHFKVPDGQTVEYRQETWKSNTLPVAQSSGMMDGANTVTLQTQLPLAPEAMLVTVNGPVLQERKIESTLQMILSTLEAQATWPQGAVGASDGAQPAKAVPATGNGKHATSAAAPAKSTKAPKSAPIATSEAKPAQRPSTWPILLICVPLAIAYIWVRVLRIRRAIPSSRGRYAVVLAGGAGIALAAGSDAVSFGGGGEALGAVFLGLIIIAFAVWRIVALPAAAPAPAGPTAPLPEGPIMVAGSDLRKMSDPKIRGLGLLFLVIAGLAIHWGIIEPMQEAGEHRESISYTEVTTLFIPYMVAFGLLLLTMGKRVLTVAGWRQSSNSALRTAVTICLIILGILGVGLLVWLKVTLHSMGYTR